MLIGPRHKLVEKFPTFQSKTLETVNTYLNSCLILRTCNGPVVVPGRHTRARARRRYLLRIRAYGDGGCKGPFSRSLMLLSTSPFFLLSPFLRIRHLRVVRCLRRIIMKALTCKPSAEAKQWGARQPRGQAGGTGVETVSLFFQKQGYRGYTSCRAPPTCSNLP